MSGSIQSELAHFYAFAEANMNSQSMVRCTKLRVVLFFSVAAIWLVIVFARDASGQQPRAMPQEILESFHGEPDQRVELWGPDAATFVKYEAEGLRVVLPAGYAGERPNTGVSIKTAIKGDFEVAISYEIQMEPPPNVTDKPSMKLKLMAVLDREQFNPFVLARIQTGEGEPRFSTYALLSDPDSGKAKTRGAKQFPANAKKGRLRMVRKGTVLSCFVMEEPETKFRLLKEFPLISQDDVKSVRILASTGGEKASLDVRFSDLTIRWGKNEVAAAAKNVALATERPEGAGWSGWLAAISLIGAAIILLFALLLGVALYLRRQNNALKSVE
jgi:hypothetical protein